MADNTAVKDTTGRIAMSPTKGPMKSLFDFFGGRAHHLNNDLGQTSAVWGIG